MSRWPAATRKMFCSRGARNSIDTFRPLPWAVTRAWHPEKLDEPSRQSRYGALGRHLGAATEDAVAASQHFEHPRQNELAAQRGRAGHEVPRNRLCSRENARLDGGGA